MTPIRTVTNTAGGADPGGIHAPERRDHSGWWDRLTSFRGHGCGDVDPDRDGHCMQTDPGRAQPLCRRDHASSCAVAVRGSAYWGRTSGRRTERPFQVVPDGPHRAVGTDVAALGRGSAGPDQASQSPNAWVSICWGAGPLGTAASNWLTHQIPPASPWPRSWPMTRSSGCLPPAGLRRQLGRAVAVVVRVQRYARCHEPVDAIQDLGVQRDAHRREL